MPQQTSTKGKILFIPLCSQGHVNFCIELAKRFLELYGDKADIYFAVDEEFKNKLEKRSNKVKYIVYQPPYQQEADNHWLIEMMQAFGPTWSENAVEYCHNCAPILGLALETLIQTYPLMTKIVQDLKPDFLIFDQLFSVPTGINQNIPYANLFSAAMNYAGLPKLPPPQGGLPTEYKPENVKLWEDFINKAYKTGPFFELKNKTSEFLKAHGCTGLDDHWFVCKVSPYLNIYGYPKELDYTEDGIELESKWVRIDSPISAPYPEPYSVPEKLKNKTGKLIYFSLGSMATVYKPLMQKMLDVLKEIPHRFIISTGMMGDQYEMADNMYGEKYLNQFSVLRAVDMIISHGGNNTLTESFHFGVPMIFVPLFGDQPDNAQRVQDKGLGKRCNIFSEPAKLKQDLEDAIDYCSKESVRLKMKKISERIQKDNGMDNACAELLKFVKKD